MNARVAALGIYPQFGCGKRKKKMLGDRALVGHPRTRTCKALEKQKGFSTTNSTSLTKQ